MIAIYVRQSLDKKDSVSIEVQVELCKKQFTGDNYKIYSDKGFSGKNIDRPAFTELLDDVRNNKIKKVIVYRLDRISRSITDFANIMELFEEHKVDFISSTEKFDTSTPMGRAMLYIIMVFAQLERETIAERIRDNYYSRGKNGVFLGGPPPLGFENTKEIKNGKKICVLKPTDDIKVVIEMFNMYANTNMSLGMIAKEFKKKHKNKYGVWNNIKLSRILHNPVYVKANADVYDYYKQKKCILPNNIDEFTGQKACFLFGKRDRGANKYRDLNEHVLALAQHDGVIDPDVFLRCQYKLDQNKQIKNSGRGKHTWLTGLVKCGYCGYSMVVKVYNGVKYLYCSGRQNNMCDAEFETVYLVDVETYVNDEIIKTIKNLEDKGVEKIGESDDNKINELKIQLWKIEDQIAKLVDSIAQSNDILISYINDKIIELDEQKRSLEKEIQQYSSKKSVNAPTLSDWESGDYESKRDIAASLFSEVLIKNDDIELSRKY